MKRKIVIGTFALCIIGGTIAFGTTKPELDDHTSFKINPHAIYSDDDVEAITTQAVVQSAKTTSSNEFITREEAVQIAEEAVNGTVYSFERDEDDGQLYYELELKTAHHDVEVEMNAKNGKIIEIDYDDLFNDDDD